jgi:hypothetical protein
MKRKIMSLRWGMALAVIVFFGMSRPALPADSNGPAVPSRVKALSRQLRVDLNWENVGTPANFEVQRARSKDGAFETLPTQLPQLNCFTDFIGQPGGKYYYRVRSVRTNGAQNGWVGSAWSQIMEASPQPLEPDSLLTEIQEASFRYFYDYAHPVSGMARVSLVRSGDLCEVGGTGWALFNLGVGVERGFITREQGRAQTFKILRFLMEKADTFHGAFPHWINGSTGRTIPFNRMDDGADLVETAFLMEGVLFAREYFSDNSAEETEIRSRANQLWRTVEWNWFAREKDGRLSLFWHWSPDYEWKKDHTISGFNECQMAYILALASPTHPVSANCYWQGWISPKYSTVRTNFGIVMELGHDLGPPLFWTHYSYLGLDPRQITFHGRTYFEHFQGFCRIQMLYALSKSNQFQGYGPLWGLTACRGPKGYHAFAPGPRDDGTIAPTAAISSMPYVPAESRACLMELYQNHGKQLWGPFGFYDSFNLSLHWVTTDYLGNDVGPIVPMIENYRTGLCWRRFMKAPEIKSVLKLIMENASARTASRTSIFFKPE